MNAGLKEKVVLITGASGSIGAATARAFAAEGARLILHYHRHRESAQRLQQELAPTVTHLVEADLRVESEVVGLFAQAQERYDRIDTLVAMSERRSFCYRFDAQSSQTITIDANKTVTATFDVIQKSLLGFVVLALGAAFALAGCATAL